MPERPAKNVVKSCLHLPARGVIRHGCAKEMDIHHISIESQAIVWVLSRDN